MRTRPGARPSCPAFRARSARASCSTCRKLGGKRMSAVFSIHETFRGDFAYRNSPAAIRRFPLPFPEDNYMYSVNIEPHLPGPPGSVTEFAFDVDEHYVAECRERAIVLAAEPLRYQALPHMMSSQWDCLELIMESLARDYP